MRYIRNQFVRAGSVMWWGFIILTGGLTTIWGIIVLQWTWAGIFTIFIGVAIFSSLIVAVANRSKIRRIVLHEFEKIPEASVEDVSKRTGISIRDVRSIVLDLKASMLFIGDFSTQTGRVHLIAPHNELNKPEIKVTYCESCGTPINDGSDTYCSYCGAKL